MSKWVEQQKRDETDHKMEMALVIMAINKVPKPSKLVCRPCVASFEFLVFPLPVAVIAAATLPNVGVGTSAFRSPFIAVAVLDKFAKPTEAGLYLKTEYTFFKKVSPTIHDGEDDPDMSRTKKAPRH